MVEVVLFHSAYGLRPAEAGAAARLRAAGHDVITPDLYSGQTASTPDAALALMGTVGWAAICARARRALDAVPGLPVQVHLAGDDPFAPRPDVAQWQADAGQTWQRVTAFLSAL